MEIPHPREFRRIGEAKRPGPNGTPSGPADQTQGNQSGEDLLSILGVNGTAVRPRWKAIAQWPATVTLFQETRLTSEAQNLVQKWIGAEPHNISSVFGAPMAFKSTMKQTPKKTVAGQTKVRRIASRSIWNAQEGGVAVFAKHAAASSFGDPGCQNPGALIAETLELRESGRWTAAAIPVGSGARCVYVHSYYAPAKQKNDPFRKSQAQRLLGLLFGVASTSGDAPTVISADLNENPDKCEILKKAIASGRWIDVGKAVAGDQVAPPTYRKLGPYPGMTCQDEATRIDVVLCNRAAWAAFESLDYEFDLGVPAHIGIRVNFRIPSFASKALYQVLPRPLPIPEDISDEEKDEIWDNMIKGGKLDEIRSLTQGGKSTKAFEMLSDIGVLFLQRVFLLKSGGDGDIDTEQVLDKDHLLRGRAAKFRFTETSACSVPGHSGVGARTDHTLKIHQTYAGAKQLLQRFSRIEASIAGWEGKTFDKYQLFYQGDHKGQQFQAHTPLALQVYRSEGTNHGVLGNFSNTQVIHEANDLEDRARSDPIVSSELERVKADAAQTYRLWTKGNEQHHEWFPQVPAATSGEGPLGLSTHAAWSAYVKRLSGAVDKKVHAIQQDRFARAKGDHDNDKQRSCRSAFSATRDPLAPPTVAVQDCEGRLVFHPAQLHKVIEEAWVGPIFQKYVVDSSPTWEKLIEEFGDEIGPRKDEFKVLPLEAKRLKARALKCQGTHGLDAWRRQEITALPDAWWEELVAILAAIEDGGNDWPEGLVQAVVPLIPKEGGSTDPMNQRPLTVLSTIYRAYAGLRYDDLERWRAQWTDSNIYGGEPDKEAIHATLSAAMDIEQAQIDGNPIIMALLDYSKFFDSLTWEIIWKLADWLGAPKGIIRAMAKFYPDLVSRFKINGHFGPAWGRTNSVAQGCPLSIIWANIIGALWSKVLTSRVPEVKKSIFIDDKALRTGSTEMFEKAMRITAKLDAICGLKLNISKVKIMTNSKAYRKWASKLVIANQKMQITNSAVSLGALLVSGKGATLKKGQERLEIAKRTLDKTARIKASNEIKGRIVEGKAIPQATFASSVAILPKTAANKLSTSVIRIVWGESFAMRAKELVWATALKPWTHHPFWASIMQCFNELLRSCIKSSEIKDQMKRNLKARLENTGEGGANGPAINLIKAAAHLGYAINAEGVLYAPGETNIPIFDQDPRWVASKIQRAMVDKFVRDLSYRCKPTRADKPDFREDLANMPEKLDIDSCTALSKWKPPKTEPKNEKDRLVSEYLERSVGSEQQRYWTVVVTGALRTHERLAAGGTVDTVTGQTFLPSCPLCGHHTENLEHIWWGCPYHENRRREFRNVLGTIIASAADPDDVRILSDPEQWPATLRTHGLMPYSEDLKGLGLSSNHTPQKIGTHFPLLGSHEWEWLDDMLLPLLGYTFERNGRIVLVAYTDGACSEQGLADIARAGFSLWFGPEHPWNEASPLPGRLQSSDRAELAAVVRTLLAHRGGDINIRSDNEHVVVMGTDLLLWHDGIGTKKPKPKHNRDHWKQFEERALQIGTARITLQWVKGHATEQMVENGQCTRQDKVGNDGADTLAVQGRQTHPIEEGVMQGIHLRRRVTMAIQTFMIITAMARSRRRLELEEERALEELENSDPSQENEQEENQSGGDIRDLPPAELNDDGLRAHFLERMQARFPGAYLPNPSGPYIRHSLGSIPQFLMAKGKEWKFPYSWIAPLHWYISCLDFPTQPQEGDPGVSWIELATDFEIATRVQLLGNGVRMKPKMQRPEQTSIMQRAYNFMYATKRLLQICGVHNAPGIIVRGDHRVSTLCPYGGCRAAGLKIRPSLLDKNAVFLEIANQALLNFHTISPESAGIRPKAWKWTPRYRGLPPRKWHASPLGNPTPFRPKVRIRGKSEPFRVEVTRGPCPLPNPPPASRDYAPSAGSDGVVALGAAPRRARRVKSSSRAGV